MNACMHERKSERHLLTTKCFPVHDDLGTSSSFLTSVTEDTGRASIHVLCLWEPSRGLSRQSVERNKTPEVTPSKQRVCTAVAQTQPGQMPFQREGQHREKGKIPGTHDTATPVQQQLNKGKPKDLRALKVELKWSRLAWSTADCICTYLAGTLILPSKHMCNNIT